MQALILAAGMGKRLKELTRNNTKCMVKVNGVTLIERLLRQLDMFHLSRIVIVIGYEGQKLTDYIGTLDINTPVTYVNNPVYDRTNNIYSLSLAKDYLLNDDTLLMESDLIFEDDVLKEIFDDPRDTLALVDKYESWMDGTCIKISEEDTIEAFVPGSKFLFDDIPNYYKTVNIYKFSRHFSETHYVPFLDAYTKALGDNEYYEQVLRVITMLDNPEIKAKKLSGQLWYEIDDIQDLDIASSMFAADDYEKLDMIQSRYGGYWRYPSLIDFCYLVNPYFPPQKLINEMKSNFEKLLTQYPSGMNVNSLLASKKYSVHMEHIIVGNGAAELIKGIMERISGKVGFVFPTFEEYPNRYSADQRVVFIPDNSDFHYTSDDLMNFYEDKDIKAIVLINPDNPSGNYIPLNDVVRFVQWCRDRSITVIFDESFIDFSDEEKDTLIDEKILCEYKNLIVVKSISKSDGVPGIRLGVMASGDEKLISEMKNDSVIWNINSFGEFYLQIEEKYRDDYRKSILKLRETRAKFSKNLSEINGLRVIPSQANFFLMEITADISARELTKRLFSEYNIYIKDLSNKIKSGRYIRTAVRSDEDNNKLVAALKNILSQYTR